MCGCACRHPELKPQLLQPGEHTNLSLTTWLPPQAHTTRLECTVHTDFPAQPHWRYAVDLSVYPSLCVVPRDISLGGVEPEQSTSRTIWVETYALAGERHREWSLPKVENLEFAPAGDPVIERLEGGVVGRRVPLSVRVNAGLQMGSHERHIYLKSDVRPSVRPLAPEATCIISWWVRGAIDVQPDGGAFFGDVSSPDEWCVRTVFLKASESPFAITQAHSTRDRVLMAEFANTRKMLHVVTLRLERDRIRGAISGEMVLAVDHPRQREVRIPWAAYRGP
jgi:hypothetical protein